MKIHSAAASSALLMFFLASPAKAFSLPNINLPGVSLVSPTLSLSFGQASGSVFLPAALKDPFSAYNLATIPYVGSFYAANYVGSNPLAVGADPSLFQAASHHLFGDLLFLASGLLLQTIPNSDFKPYAGVTGGMIALGGPFLSRFLFQGPYFANQAVSFNRRQYEEFNYHPWFSPSQPKKDSVKTEKKEKAATPPPPQVAP